MYPGNPSEQKLKARKLEGWQDARIDLSETVITDKIETNKKPELLKERHNVKTDSGIKEDLNTMGYYEEMAKYYNELEERSEMAENKMKDMHRMLNEQRQMLEALRAENTSLRKALAEAQKAS